MAGKKIFNWQLALGLVFILLSAVFYYAHYLIFRDAHHIFIYLIGDIAFVFLEVFLVTMVVHNLLSLREKQALFKKLNMVIGVFFSEVGRELAKFCVAFDEQGQALTEKFLVRESWTSRQFKALQKDICVYGCAVDPGKGDLEGLKKFLVGKRPFLLALLENQNLLEHESFTDLLWAVFHLTEELEGRHTLQGLTPADYKHLSGDIQRAYRQLLRQWLAYMQHLKEDYPYLFSLAMRTNPFDRQAQINLR